ncbi:hypothetical protein ACFLZU_04115 [Thermodesulfobacteriota bacterium]
MSLFPKYQPDTHAKPAKPAKPEPTLATLATLAAPSVTEPSASSPSFQSIQKEDATQSDLQRLVGETLQAVDREGRPWPARFLSSLPATDRDRLRQLERDIDEAVLSGDAPALTGLLNEWRTLLISRLN